MNDTGDLGRHSTTAHEGLRGKTLLNHVKLRINEKAMYQFQSQHLVDLDGVVSISFEMTSDDVFDGTPLEVWPGKCPRVEQHFTNVLSEGTSVPDSEM